MNRNVNDTFYPFRMPSLFYFNAFELHLVSYWFVKYLVLFNNINYFEFTSTITVNTEAYKIERSYVPDIGENENVYFNFYFIEREDTIYIYISKKKTFYIKRFLGFTNLSSLQMSFYFEKYCYTCILKKLKN